jgi:hypothetical protein
MIHQTKCITTKNANGINGWMMPFAKTSEDFWKEYNIKYVYATSILPGTVKGPILHLKRECRLVAVSGECDIVVKDEKGYTKTRLSFSNPAVISIPTGNKFCVYGSSDKECILINVANHCWTEEDQDAHQVLDWDYIYEQ